jgi:hypothetical protein
MTVATAANNGFNLKIRRSQDKGGGEVKSFGASFFFMQCYSS